VISTLFWNDGTIAQMTERVQINARPYRSQDLGALRPDVTRCARS
jgi:hypothetical protein